MQTINKLLALVDGKKTYIVAVLTVIIGILQSDTPLTFQGLIGLTLRHAIAKVTP